MKKKESNMKKEIKMKTIMKSMTLFMCLTLIQLASMNVQAQVSSGAGGGNGGDNVEPLFINAQAEAISLLNEITVNNVDSLNIDQPYKNWLMTSSNLSHLQFYAKAMKLSFQDSPCNEDKKPRSTSYFTGEQSKPTMCISYSYNRVTTPEQAIALVIHEAGHFSGEKDHIFLSGLGMQLATQNANKEQTYTVPGPEAFMHTKEVLATCKSKFKTCFIEQNGYTQVIKGTNRYIPSYQLVTCEIGKIDGYVIWFVDTAQDKTSSPSEAGETLEQAVATANNYITQQLCGKIKMD